MSVTNEILNIGESFESGNATAGINSIANVTKAGIGVAKKIGNLISNNDSTPKHIRDLYTNGFQAIGDESIFRPNVFARAFDEPTYLTFRVEFCFDDPIRNMMYNQMNVGIDTTWNYARMYDYMPEPFLQRNYKQYEGVDRFSAWENIGEDIGVDNLIDFETADIVETTDIGNTLSTSDYLINALGDYGRHKMLDFFIAALADIQNNYPFYFTNISGLSSLSNIDPKRGSRLKDAKISIECYEALDLRITQLMQLYRKIVWDDVYQRWVLPDMMRYFSMKIYVSEIRLFHEMRGSVGKSKNPRLIDMRSDRNNARFMGKKNLFNDIVTGLNTAAAVATAFTGTNNVINHAAQSVAGVMNAANEIQDEIAGFYTKLCNNAINSVMPTICYDCHMCEFDISSMMGYLDSLKSSIKGTDSPKPKIQIKIGQVTETQVYPLNAYLGKTLDNTYSTGPGLTRSVISDEALNKRFTNNARKTGEFESEYKQHIMETINYDGTNAETPLWRFGRKDNGLGGAVLSNDLGRKKDLTYNIDDPGDMLSIASLSTMALNELGDGLANRTGNSGIFSKSEATNPRNPAAVHARTSGNVYLSASSRDDIDPKDISEMGIPDNAYIRPEADPTMNVIDDAYTDRPDAGMISDPNNASNMGVAGNQLPDVDLSDSAPSRGSISERENEYELVNPYVGLDVPQESIWPGDAEFSATDPTNEMRQQAENFEIADNGDPVFPPEPNIWEEKSPYSATNPDRSMRQQAANFSINDPGYTPIDTDPKIWNDKADYTATEPSDEELQQAENFSINDPGYTPIKPQAKIWNDKAKYTATEPSDEELQQADNFSINDPGYSPINTEPRIWDGEYKSTATNPDDAMLQQAKNFEIESAKDILIDIAERIWNSPEIKSTATSEEMREQVAESVFNNVMEEIYKSSATDDRANAIRSVIKAYRENGQ